MGRLTGAISFPDCKKLYRDHSKQPVRNSSTNVIYQRGKKKINKHLKNRTVPINFTQNKRINRGKNSYRSSSYLKRYTREIKSNEAMNL